MGGISPRAAGAAAISLAVTLAAGLALAHLQRAQADREERAQAVGVASDAARSLEQEVGRSLSATYALAAVLRQHGEIEDFDRLAAELLPFYGGLAALQLAPGGVIRQIHPLEGNEAALGHDLLRAQDRRFQAQEAIRTRRLTVAGPFELKQGGVGLVGRLPVFFRDAPAPAPERFWGFVIGLVRLKGLIEQSRLANLSPGHAWELSRLEPESERRLHVAGAGPLDRDPVAVTVVVPNGEWRLEVSPQAGWGVARRSRLPEVVAVVIALLAAALTFILVRQPDLLRRQIEERTAELERANALLAESQKLESIGRLAGGIAHDFNNLLTVILSCAHTLGEGLRDGAPKPEDVDEIRAAGERARDLTAQLLAFARKQVITPEPLDLSEVLRGMERLLRRVLDEDVRLETSLPDGLWPVRADRGQIGQVVLNLAVNARDAMPSGGRLAIEAANVSLGAAARAKELAPGPYVRLSFRDTGHGMSPGVRAHLFEPFFTTKPKGRGTGLGLPTVYGIVKQSGGHVEVESQEGAGTAVHVYLPRSGEPATPARPAAEAPRRGGSETVLVVEDDRHVREVTVRTLREAGYRVIVAPDAGAALAAAAAEPGPIDLLVTDVIMPGLDGRALAGQLCGHRPGLRALFVSGYAERVVAEGGVLAAGLELLSKPFTPTALLDRVRALLDKAPEGPGQGGAGPTG